MSKFQFRKFKPGAPGFRGEVGAWRVNEVTQAMIAKAEAELKEAHFNLLRVASESTDPRVREAFAYRDAIQATVWFLQEPMEKEKSE